MMAEASIPVDLLNPGQVFACLGFLEAADGLCGEARGGFDWRGSDGVRFRLEASGNEDPVARVLRFLDEATVESVAPVCSSNCTDKWKVETRTDPSGSFPFPDPSTPATLPANLRDKAGRSLTIDHWGDATSRDSVKFWAGAYGKPGAAFVQDALELMRGRMGTHMDDPFALAAEQRGSLRFDWRRDYVPLDAGFSPNAHGDVVMQGYPIVELMAAVGLTHARPSRRDKLNYSYGVIGLADGGLHDPIFLRAALGARKEPFPGIPFRLFGMRLAWPGQENQARCITNVIEEASPS